MEQKFLTPSEAAQYLAVPAGTLAHWRLHRRGPRFSRVNTRCVRYHIADLDAWLAGHQVGTADQPKDLVPPTRRRHASSRGRAVQ